MADKDPSNTSPDQPVPDKLARATLPEAAIVEPRRIIPVAAAAVLPPALSATPDALALLRALRRRWFLAGALGCLAAALAVAAALVVVVGMVKA